MKKVILLGVACLLAGCVMRMNEFSEKMNEKWSGRSYDEFVMEKGAPKSTQKLQNGMTMYTWETSRCRLSVLVDKSNNIESFKVLEGSNFCRPFLW